MKQLFFHLVPVLAFGLILALVTTIRTSGHNLTNSLGATARNHNSASGTPLHLRTFPLGVETREWSFEDATPATSTDPEPSVVFNSKGIKTVTLTIHFLNGQVQSESFDIEVFYPLSARIKALELTPKGCIRLDTPVSFGLTEVEGNPTSYQWTFEGGTPSSSTDPRPSGHLDFGQQKRSPNLLQTHSGRRRNDNYRRTDFYCRKLSNAAPHSREGL